MEVNSEIKKYLKENGISQAHLSRKTGIDTVTLNMVLNSKRRLTLEEYGAICYALGVGTEKFLHPKPLTESAGDD